MALSLSQGKALGLAWALGLVKRYGLEFDPAVSLGFGLGPGFGKALRP